MDFRVWAVFPCRLAPLSCIDGTLRAVAPGEGQHLWYVALRVEYHG